MIATVVQKTPVSAIPAPVHAVIILFLPEMINISIDLEKIKANATTVDGEEYVTELLTAMDSLEEALSQVKEKITASLIELDPNIKTFVTDNYRYTIVRRKNKFEVDDEASEYIKKVEKEIVDEEKIIAYFKNHQKYPDGVTPIDGKQSLSITALK